MRPEEFHCQVFTGLLEKLFLAVFCRQEMIVGETTTELGSLVLMEKVGSLQRRGQVSQRHNVHIAIT